MVAESVATFGRDGRPSAVRPGGRTSFARPQQCRRHPSLRRTRLRFGRSRGKGSGLERCLLLAVAMRLRSGSRSAAAGNGSEEPICDQERKQSPVGVRPTRQPTLKMLDTNEFKLSRAGIEHAQESNSFEDSMESVHCSWDRFWLHRRRLGCGHRCLADAARSRPDKHLGDDAAGQSQCPSTLNGSCFYWQARSRIPKGAAAVPKRELAFCQDTLAIGPTNDVIIPPPMCHQF